jgi:hypothetical protein
MNNIFKTAVTLSVISLFYLSSSQAQPLTKPFWFTPANQLEAKVFVDVSYTENTKIFSYKYTVENLSSSQQSLFLWGLAKNLSENQLKPPKGWTVGIYSGVDFSAWAYLEGDINPGQSAQGFSVSSPLLPGLVDYYYQSDPSSALMPNRPSEPAEEDYEVFATLSSFPTNYARGTTIGPSIEPFQDFDSAFYYLEKTIQLSSQKAWIYHKGVKSSIEKKMENIQMSLGKKNNTLAKNQAKALHNHISVMNNKQIHPDAKVLILSIAEYLLTL